MDYDLK